jgi:hypothetical protein
MDEATRIYLEQRVRMNLERYTPEEFERVRKQTMQSLDVAPPGWKPWAHGRIDDLVHAELAYMKICISCGSKIQPCCGH